MKVLISILLYIIASLVAPFINIIGLVFAILNTYLNGRYSGNRKAVLSTYLMNNAKSKDQHANAANWHLFNFLMIKKEVRFYILNDIKLQGYIIDNKVISFGNIDHTLSYVFGKNKELNALNKHGLFWAAFLNKIDKGHVENAVNAQEN